MKQKQIVLDLHDQLTFLKLEIFIQLEKLENRKEKIKLKLLEV